MGVGLAGGGAVAARVSQMPGWSVVAAAAAASSRVDFLLPFLWVPHIRAGYLSRGLSDGG